MKILLDTNAYSALMRGESTLVDSVRQVNRLIISAVVAGELLQGFRGGSRFQANLTRLIDFLGEPQVDLLPVSLTTAQHYGRISAELRSAGQPIPQNDIWIAAHAFQAGAELWSYDAHFENVSGLSWKRLPA